MPSILCSAISLSAALLLGCASPNVDLPTPKPNTGYVDIFSADTNAISWAILDAQTQKSIYAKYEPQSGILRLAFRPGSHQLTIEVLNKMTGDPPTVQVSVLSGHITPVRVQLLEAGQMRLARRDDPFAETRQGRYANKHNVSRDELQTYEIKPEVLEPIRYVPKETAPYAVRN